MQIHANSLRIHEVYLVTVLHFTGYCSRSRGNGDGCKDQCSDEGKDAHRESLKEESDV